MGCMTSSEKLAPVLTLAHIRVVSSEVWCRVPPVPKCCEEHMTFTHDDKLHDLCDHNSLTDALPVVF